MTNDVPQHFDRAFLHWFQERTEETWQKYQTRTFESFVAARVGGSDWQQGTRWLSGLDKQEIASIEQRYQVHFHRPFSFAKCVQTYSTRRPI